MATKVIGIGNLLMSDDGVGVRVAEHLQPWLEAEFGLEVIIGETDVDYCLEKIEDGDEVWIIDSTLLGQAPGTVTVHPLDQLDLWGQVSFSLHQLSLVRLLRLERINVQGYLIGIEAQSLEFGLELSAPLQREFETICEGVKIGFGLWLAGGWGVGSAGSR